MLKKQQGTQHNRAAVPAFGSENDSGLSEILALNAIESGTSEKDKQHEGAQNFGVVVARYVNSY